MSSREVKFDISLLTGFAMRPKDCSLCAKYKYHRNDLYLYELNYQFMRDFEAYL